MSRPFAPLILAAALAATCLPLMPPASAAASADTPAALTRAVPEPMPRWGRPPEAVRNAAAALCDACAAWPKLVPLASEPSVPLTAEEDQPYVSSCHLALDPEGSSQSLLLQGGALGAAAAGLAAVMFKLASLLLSGLGGAASRGLHALQDRRRLGGWSE